MSNTSVQRLGSIHLEDLAILALTGRVDIAASGHRDLDDDRRARLRSRIKLISRHDWPASLREDPLVRRGYTLRQCLRLIVALMLVDAHLAPSFAIAIARANEPAFLKVMVERIVGDPNVTAMRPDDVLAVMMLGELVELIAEKEWNAAQPQRARFVKRQDVARFDAVEEACKVGGQRLVLDLGSAGATVWRWLVERRLMTSIALDRLVAELAESEVNYVAGETKIRRR